jgi:hypothetical protein
MVKADCADFTGKNALSTSHFYKLTGSGGLSRLIDKFTSMDQQHTMYLLVKSYQTRASYSELCIQNR